MLRGKQALWAIGLLGCARPTIAPPGPQEPASADAALPADFAAAVGAFDLTSAVSTDLAAPSDLAPACIPACGGRCDVADTCGGLCGCPAGSGCVSQTCQPLPRTFASPVPPALWGGRFATAFHLTLAADDPATIIYYTIDGSAPSMSSMSGQTPVSSLLIFSTAAAPTTVRYFGVTLAGAEPEHRDDFGVDTTLTTSAAYAITDTKLDGKSATVVASAGQVFGSAQTSYQMWVQTAHPLYRAQLVYGVDAIDQGCLYDAGPGAFPGTGLVLATFSVKAPTTPGVHEVKVASIEELDCATAMSMNAIATRPTASRIGVLIVK